MKIKRSTVSKILITDIPHDPISVYLEDFGVGQGNITITCFEKSWSNYWSSMGSGYDIRKFFSKCDTQYLAGKLGSNIDEEIHDLSNLDTHIKKKILQSRYKGIFSKDDARRLYCEVDAVVCCDYLNDDTSRLMEEVFGEEWYYDIPRKKNPKYIELCEVINYVKIALQELSKEEN